jgi:hypothetical protein
MIKPIPILSSFMCGIDVIPGGVGRVVSGDDHEPPPTCDLIPGPSMSPYSQRKEVDLRSPLSCNNLNCAASEKSPFIKGDWSDVNPVRTISRSRSSTSSMNGQSGAGYCWDEPICPPTSAQDGRSDWAGEFPARTDRRSRLGLQHDRKLSRCSEFASRARQLDCRLGSFRAA